MKKHRIIIFSVIVFVIFFGEMSAYAMTQQEVDKYNNLYYPQSVYNGGINSSENTNSQEAYVDPATGSTHIRVTDITLPGAGGFDLNITRTYNSQNSALFEAYLKETNIEEPVTYYMIKGRKRIYEYYTSGTSDLTSYSNICLTPDFMTYLNSKNAVWMVKNSSAYEYEYQEQPANSKLFRTETEAQEVVDYLNSISYEIQASLPYENTIYYNIDYYSFSVAEVKKTETVTQYTDGLLDDTANERYSKLGIGWEFDFPYVETRYGYDDTYEYLHFCSKGTYLIDLGSDGGENHLSGYPLNDIKLTYDTSVTHDGIRSKYLVTEKNGTKHYFGKDGRLLYQEDRYGNRIKFYCDTDVYTNVWGQNKSYPYIIKIVDSVGRSVVFTQTSETSGDITLAMTITNPDNSEDVREFKYCLDKLSSKEIGIMGNAECRDLEGDEWVLKYVYDPEEMRTRYYYNILKTKFSFMDRNDVFYYDYYDVRNLLTGNSIIDNDNLEEFKGIHNAYALVNGVEKKGYKSYYFNYSRFIKNCTPSGSMMFGKAYEYCEESMSSYDNSSYDINKRKYNYDFYNVGEYDGYIGYRRDDKIGSNYNYAVKVEDRNLTAGKTSYDIFKYSYIGAKREKTILLSRLTDEGSEHKVITDYGYDNTTKLITSVNQKNYSVTDSSDYMTTSKTYTYDSGNYADVLTETPNGAADRAASYTYDANYHFPLSRTYKQSANKEIKLEYVPTSNGKSIEYVNLYENNVLKNKIQYAHDSYGNIINQKEYADNLADYIETEYVYQSGANLLSETKKNIVDNDNASENITVSATYDYWGNPITQTDGKGNTTSYTYDKINRVMRITNPNSSTKSYIYEPCYKIETDELNNRSRIYYTNAREVEEIRYISLGVDYNTRYYDAFGNLATEVLYSEETDENGKQKPHSITKYAYDTMQRPISKEVFDKDNMLIYKEIYSYEVTADYQKKTTTIVGDSSTPSVVTSEYTDKFGSKIKTENGTDYETYTNDYQGNVLTVKSTRANSEGWTESATSSFEYNYMDKAVKETDVLGNSTRTEYDSFGRKVKEYDQNGYASEYKYDAQGRLVEQKSPIEDKNGTVYYAVKKMWYDKNDNLVRERVNTNAADEAERYNEVEYTYDNRNRLVMTKSFDSEKYSYVQNYYDKKGNLLRVYTGLSSPLTFNGLDDISVGDDNEYAVTKYTYDELSRVTETADALGQTETNTYDKATGLVMSSTDRNGQGFVYGYDGLNNLKTKSLSDGTNAETKTYCMTGQITSAQNSTTTISYVYNDKGLPVSETDTAAGTVKSFTYDSNGNRLTFTLTRNGQAEISQNYVYDKLNRLISVSENGTVIATYSYDNKNNRVQTVSGGETTNYTYNIANLMTSQTTGDKLNEQYTYYLNGNQKTKTSNGTLTAYEYDGMNRLSKENDTEYSFDDFGNRKSMTSGNSTTSYTYDLNNRLTKSIEKTGSETKTTTMFYDKNGNQISKAVMTNKPFGENVTGDYTVSQNSNENVALYDYNCYNQLVGVDTNGVISSYTYAPDGMRASKTVAGNTTNFVYDNANVIEEITADGVNKYFRGLEIIKNGDNIYYFYNGQGDVSILADTAGNTAASYIFDAYGNQSEENTVYNPFGYRGEYTDSESGLVYLRARMYDPETGRFINEDSYWNVSNKIYGDKGDKVPDITAITQSSNLYVYCGNDPINVFDSMGNNWFSDRWGDVKWAFKTIGNYANKAQKKAQRTIWSTGADLYLRKTKGYLTSAWMLEHSLQDNPSDIWRGNDSRIAYLINNDYNFSAKVNEAIQNSNGWSLNNAKIGVVFDSQDLYYSIHKSTIYLTGSKNQYGSWIINCVLYDTYDFTEIQSFMSDDGSFQFDASLGTVANDAAYISQKTGAIKPYGITVDFWITR